MNELITLKLFSFLFLTFFNTSLLQTYIHGALEDMRHWYSQHFISHKHGMNEHRGKIQVDESISLKKKKKSLYGSHLEEKLEHEQLILALCSYILHLYNIFS